MFEQGSHWNRPLNKSDEEFIKELDEQHRRREKERRARAVKESGVPLEGWYHELIGLATRKDISLEAGEIARELADEVYSYLRG